MLGFGAISASAISSLPHVSIPDHSPAILIQIAYVSFLSRHSEGQIVQACDLPWKVISDLLNDGDDLVLLLAKNPRKLEELIAAAYSKAGFEVVLTPRSGDGGKDIIATLKGQIEIRIIDQVKAYSPTTRVTHDDVRAMLGVLGGDNAASKGIITTTYTFQPEVRSSIEFAKYMPTRLQLRDKNDLVNWFKAI